MFETPLEFASPALNSMLLFFLRNNFWQQLHEHRGGRTDSSNFSWKRISGSVLQRNNFNDLPLTGALENYQFQHWAWICQSNESIRSILRSKNIIDLPLTGCGFSALENNQEKIGIEFIMEMDRHDPFCCKIILLTLLYRLYWVVSCVPALLHHSPSDPTIPHQSPIDLQAAWSLNPE